MVTRAPSVLSINKLRLNDVKWFAQDHTVVRAGPKTISPVGQCFHHLESGHKEELGWIPPSQTRQPHSGYRG